MGRTLIRGLMPMLLAGVAAGATPPPAFSHQDWTEVLQRFVDERGRVDYQGLARNRESFDRYIAAVERTGPATDPELFPSRDHELAYYINAYNALVFKGVLSRGPETKSVWSGGLISGYGFFVGMDITIEGRRTHLKPLEDKVIRDRFEDPRVHAALNCASLGCPRLPRRAFEAEGLDAALDAAMTEFVIDPLNCEIDRQRQVVKLSKIFDWFAEDFVGSRENRDAALIEYINRFRPEADRIPTGYSVKFSKYDKRINAQQAGKM